MGQNATFPKAGPHSERTQRREKSTQLSSSFCSSLCCIRLKERRLRHAAGQRHQAGLHVGCTNAYPALVGSLGRPQLFHQFAEFCPLGLDLVHQVDFVLVSSR